MHLCFPTSRLKSIVQRACTVAVVAVVNALVAPASAHDELEITVEARRLQDSFMVEIIQTRDTILLGCSEETSDTKVFGPNQFDLVKDAFEKCGSSYFTLMSSDGDILEPKSVTAYLTRESHVAIRLIFDPVQSDSVLEANLFERYEGMGTNVMVYLWNERTFVRKGKLTEVKKDFEIPVTY